MSKQKTETLPEKLSKDLTQYRGGLVRQYGKAKGWISSPLAGDGARLDAAADTILKAIKRGSVSLEMAQLSFEALKICGVQLLVNEHGTDMDFQKKEQDREQLLAILTHIQNVNRKYPDNAKELKENIRGTNMQDIWRDVDGIRQENQSKNWARLKIALFGLMCAIAIAIIVTALLTPVGWAGVGAFFIGMAVNFFMPYLSQLIGTMVISAVTFGFMKTMRPLDTLAAERQLSMRTEQGIASQKRESADELRKFHDATQVSRQHLTPTHTAAKNNGGSNSREKFLWDESDTDSNEEDSEEALLQPFTNPLSMRTSSQSIAASSAGRSGSKRTDQDQSSRLKREMVSPPNASATKRVPTEKNKADLARLRNPHQAPEPSLTEDFSRRSGSRRMGKN